MKYKHTQRIKSCDIDNKELAKEIGDLYYDSLEEFLVELARKIKSDAKADEARGRKKLAKALFDASLHIQEASQSIAKAWDISKPYVDAFFQDKKSNRD